MTVWVTNPIETEEYLYLFLKETGNTHSCTQRHTQTHTHTHTHLCINQLYVCIYTYVCTCIFIFRSIIFPSWEKDQFPGSKRVRISPNIFWGGGNHAFPVHNFARGTNNFMLFFSKQNSSIPLCRTSADARPEKKKSTSL